MIKPFYYTTAVGQENVQNVSLYYPTALCRVQIIPKTSTNITHGICTSEDQLDRFSHNVQATNWTEVKKKNGGQFKSFFFMTKSCNGWRILIQVYSINRTKKSS